MACVVKEGVKAAPITAGLIATQMGLQNVVEKRMLGDDNKASFPSKLGSSAVVGFLSSPVLAIFNGRALGLKTMESLKRFTVKQCLAFTVQETAFVCGLSASDYLAEQMKNKFGDSPAVGYVAPFTAGTLGAMAGHPANSAITRWQSGLKVESVRQLMWGLPRRAVALGVFSVLYKFGKKTLNPPVENSK